MVREPQVQPPIQVFGGLAPLLRAGLGKSVQCGLKPLRSELVEGRNEVSDAPFGVAGHDLASLVGQPVRDVHTYLGLIRFGGRSR